MAIRPNFRRLWLLDGNPCNLDQNLNFCPKIIFCQNFSYLGRNRHSEVFLDFRDGLKFHDQLAILGLIKSSRKCRTDVAYFRSGRVSLILMLIYTHLYLSCINLGNQKRTSKNCFSSVGVSGIMVQTFTGSMGILKLRDVEIFWSEKDWGILNRP